MTDREFEYILKSAVDGMPVPEKKMKFTVRRQEETKKKEVNLYWRVLKPVCVAFVLVLCVGAVFIGSMAYAYEENGGFGMWASGSSREAAEREFKVKFADAYGDYEYKYATSLVVPSHEAESFLDALTTSKYSVESIDYQIEGSDRETLSISVGNTEQEYWKHYFGFDEAGELYDLENNSVSDDTIIREIIAKEIIKYEGLQLVFVQRVSYYDGFFDGKCENTELVWVDHEKGICVSMSTSYKLLEKEEMLGYAMEFIEGYRK